MSKEVENWIYSALIPLMYLLSWITKDQLLNCLVHWFSFMHYGDEYLPTYHNFLFYFSFINYKVLNEGLFVKILIEINYQQK